MLYARCDVCRTECMPTAALTRRYEQLANSLDALPVGLEIILLQNGEQSNTCHVCDECFPKLLFQSLETFADSNVVKRLKQQGARVVHFELVDKEREAELIKLKQRESSVIEQMKQAETKYSEADARERVAQQRVKDAAFKIAEAEKRESEAQKRAAHAEHALQSMTKQLASDQDKIVQLNEKIDAMRAAADSERQTQDMMKDAGQRRREAEQRRLGVEMSSIEIQEKLRRSAR